MSESERPAIDGYSVGEARQHGRACALAGKPIWANPFLGETGQVWFEAFRSVPPELHGSAPPPPSRTRVRANGKGSPFHREPAVTPR
jgi:hypothetical protein